MIRRHDDLAVRMARAALTQVIEPADAFGSVLVDCWGPVRTVNVILGKDHPSSAEWRALGERAGQFRASLERWQRKRSYVNPDQALDCIARLDGGLLIPEDPEWPSALNDLGSQKPLGLWWIGRPIMPSLARTVSVVGSREATQYGTQATRRFVRWLVEHGFSAASGGAYGIDAATHSAALDHGNGAEMPTFAVLAGGLDQFYPAGNQRLLEQIVDHGSVLSELPPGFRPNRYRFLHRNRLLAALSSATLIVEARWRSGAQNTAGHALSLGREVGAVPGPIDSASSAGCHRLLRDSPALLIADESDLAELVGWKDDQQLTVEPHDAASTNVPVLDGLSDEARLIFEALPLRSGTSVDKLCAITGSSAGDVLRQLVRLQRAGRSEKVAGGWRKILA